MTIELSDVKLNYIPIAQARRMSGLRIVLGAYPIRGRGANRVRESSTSRA